MGPESLEAAIADFEKKFKDKSGLTWQERGEEPKPKKYTYLERNYDSDDEGEQDDEQAKQQNDVKSELPIQTQHLMELIFNANHFNAVLEEIGYDSEKLPLGKLGQSTLKTGFEHLRELASLIKHPSLAGNKYNSSREEVGMIRSSKPCANHNTGHRKLLQQVLLYYPPCLWP